jgi:hypothetical protein
MKCIRNSRSFVRRLCHHRKDDVTDQNIANLRCGLWYVDPELVRPRGDDKSST